MAVQVSNGAVAYSAANNVLTAKASNMGLFNTTSLVLTSTRTITYTLDATTHNSTGVIVAVSTTTAAIDRSVQAVIKKGGVTQQTWTITAASITNSVADRYGFYIIPITGTAATNLDNGATWTVEISQTGGTTGNWNLLTSNGTVPFYVEITDITANLTTDDTLVDIDGMTCDATFRLKGTLGTGETAYAPALIICRSATAPTWSNQVGHKIAMDSGTLTIDGGILLGSFSVLWQGTPVAFTGAISAAATSATLSAVWAGTTGTYQLLFSEPTAPTSDVAYEYKTVTLTNGSAAVSWTGGLVYNALAYGLVSARTQVIQFGITNGTPTVGTKTGIWDPQISLNLVSALKMSWFAFGFVPTYETTTLAAQANVGNSSITVGDDFATLGWSTSDILSIGKTEGKNQGDYTQYAIAAGSSGTTINITPNIVVKHLVSTTLQPAKVVRLNGYGIRILGGSATTTTSRFSGASNIVECGVEHGHDGGTTYARNLGDLNRDDSANTSAQWHSHCTSWTLSTETSAFLIGSVTVSLPGMAIVYCNSANNSLTASTGHQAGAPGLIVHHCICHTHNFSLAQYLTVGDSMTDCIFSNTNRAFSTLNGAAITYKRNKHWGGTPSAGAVQIYGCSGMDWSNNDFDYNGVAIWVPLSTNLIDTITSDTFGTEAANTTDFYFASLGYSQLQVNTSTGSPAVTATSTTLQQNLVAYGADGFYRGTWLRFEPYGGSATDFRSWYPYGTFVSSSTDKIVALTLDAAYTLKNSYQFSTGSVTGFPIYARVKCTLADVGTSPSIELFADLGVTTQTQAGAASLSQQSIATTIIPTTDNNNLNVQLIQSGTAANVTWTDLIINLRSIGYQFQSTSTTLVKTTDAIQGAFLTPVVDPYWSVTNPVTLAGYSTLFDVDFSANTITVLDDATKQQMYDYVHYLLTLAANRDYTEELTTQDGSTYVSGMDIIVNTGIALTGGGAIDLGTRTFTLTGTATYDGIYIDTTGRNVHIALSGIVAGSTVWIYDTTSSTALYNAIVGATTLDSWFTWTVNHGISIRVRKDDYQPWSTTGTITNNGISITVGQLADANYNDIGIDGSTVTECALSGGTIEIFVDDPDNTTALPRIYAWWKYITATTTYIGIQDTNNLVALTPTKFQTDNSLLIQNLDTTNPLELTGGNIVNSSGSATGVLDTSNGASIAVNAATVEPNPTTGIMSQPIIGIIE
jgi:hypothetical protein